MFSFLFLVSAALSSQTVEVVGTPQDASVSAAPQGEAEIWISAVRGKRRRLYSTATGKKPVVIDSGAIFVGLNGEAILVQKRNGIYALDGNRLLKGSGILSKADQRRLFFADLHGPGEEIRFVAHDGIHVQKNDAPESVLRAPFTFARAYSGPVRRGITSQKRYAVALSVFAPILKDLDVDGDGDLDLVALLDRTVAVYERKADGQLGTTPAVGAPLVPEFPDDELRVVFGDIDGDMRADIVVGAHHGRLPSHSSAWLITANASNEYSQRKKLWRREGLVEPIMIPAGSSKVTVIHVNTNTVALGKVLMGAGAAINIENVDMSGRVVSAGPQIDLDIDIRKGRLAGQPPVASVDFNGDGKLDLLSFVGRDVSLFLGSAQGISSSRESKVKVAEFDRVVALPKARAVVLLHESSATVVRWASSRPTR